MQRTIEKITFEIDEIEELLASYSPLIESCKSKTPDLIETTALATVLHSFYSGLEKIFVIIAKEIDHRIPKDEYWHRSLLVQVSEDTDLRKAVISKESLHTLNEYLSFRHVFRHGYFFRLRWGKVEDMVINIFEVW